MFTPLIQVAIGGALGASARYLTGLWMLRAFGSRFPWGTITVNIVGAFLIGVLITVLSQRGASAYAPFLVTGMLGGFTTFSAFSLDAFTLFERGQVMAAGAYVAGSVLLSLVAIMAGVYGARWVVS